MGCITIDYEKEDREAKQQKNEQEQKVLIEQALCTALEILESKGIKIREKFGKKVADWWDAHTKAEEDRIKEEALAKLSPREKRVLGLK